MAVLRVLTGLNPGQLFPLEHDSAVLGRHPGCDIVLDVSAVSRRHAKILRINGEYYVEDMHSRNGTFLNDRLVTERQQLVENDRLRICDVVFVFHKGPPPTEADLEQSTNTGDATVMVVDDERTTSGSTIMSKVEVATGSTGLGLAVNAEAKLKALVEIGNNLGKAIGLGEVLPKLLDGLFAIFVQADRGFIVLKAPNSGRLIPKALKHRRNQETETIRISRTIVNEVMDTKEAILSADAATDSRFDMAESIVDFHIRSMMCAPLIGSEGNALGVIQIDALDQQKRFTREDLDVLASVASHVAFAVENAQLHETALRQRALERELAIAHEVQQGFLPDAPPEIDGYGFFDFYDPASQLGGDYYDYVRLPDGRLAVVLADVSGKGIAAALLVGRLSAETRYSLVSQPTPADAMDRLNDVFCENRWEDRFVTALLVVLDPLRHEVTVVNAGHMAPLLCRAPATVEAIGQAESGLPLGVQDNVSYGQSSVTLEPGDCLTLYTDGITEAMNNDRELYGHGRLRGQLDSPVHGVASLGRQILNDVRQFVGNRPQADDMCLICFGREKRR